MSEIGALASELLTPGGKLSQRDLEDLASALAEVLDRAPRAWPGVRVEPRRFVRYLAARLPPDGPPAAALAALHTSDLYLACACAGEGNERAIEAIEAAFFRDSDAALARLGPGADFADEVKQRARAKLFVTAPDRPPRITAYSGHGELRAFVRVVLMREAISLRRRDRRDPTVAADTAPVQWETTDPELLHLRRKYAAEFARAFQETVLALTSEERNLLRYHYVDRLNIDHVGAIYGIHRVSAARRLTKVRAALVEGTRSKLAQSLRLDGSELRSVLRLIESQVDISLRRALGEAQLGA